MSKEKTKFNPSKDILETGLYDLVVHNDDVNTFDFVIETLIDVCKHAPEQAEQCTLIIHHKGKCTVKTGGYNKMRSMYKEILNRKITATIEARE